MPIEPDGQGPELAVLNEGKSKQTNIARARRPADMPAQKEIPERLPESFVNSISKRGHPTGSRFETGRCRYDCPKAPKNKTCSRSLVLGAGTPPCYCISRKMHILA